MVQTCSQSGVGISAFPASSTLVDLVGDSGRLLFGFDSFDVFFDVADVVLFETVFDCFRVLLMLLMWCLVWDSI